MNDKKKKIGMLMQIKHILIGLVIGAALVAALALWIYFRAAHHVDDAAADQEKEPEVITESMLREIIDVSNLSTFEAAYNGVAVRENEEKPDQIDYYVAYEAHVKAGIDFDEIEIQVDPENKNITIHLPEPGIIDVNVDMTSLDYMWYNEKANTTAVSQEAYKLCEADAMEGSREQSKILELAKKNARSFVLALTKPLVEQLDAEYTLTVD